MYRIKIVEEIINYLQDNDNIEVVKNINKLFPDSKHQKLFFKVIVDIINNKLISDEELDFRIYNEVLSIFNNLLK